MNVSKIAFVFLAFPLFVYSSELLSPIEIQNKKETEPSLAGNVTGDSAKLLDMTPGLSFQTGGGISSLPVIQGMSDDRIKIKIDGATITSTCSNHMNPALSYVDPGKVSKISVLAGITPVSSGGDSIGGSIIVTSKAPNFATGVESHLQKINLKSYFKSNNENRGVGLNYEIANKDLSLSYSGLDDRANNYRSGRGNRLKGTLYNQNNQMMTLGKKLSSGVVALKLSRANVPYQGFINQYMDLADNVANFGSVSYKGSLGQLGLEASVFYQHTNHYMNKLSSERLGKMPMYSRSDEMGYNLKGELELSKYSNFIFGSEFAYYRLDDWWPPVTSFESGMGPGTFESINNGKRDRLAFFVELDSNWDARFSSNIGLRTDLVSMNTSNVKGYSGSNLPADADDFNSRSHDKLDINSDATLSGKLKFNSNFDIEAGLARKTRSPNIYERYAWAGSVTSPSTNGAVGMDMRMINWFGDGNGYVGNLDLKPEVAHKISASFVLHDNASNNWEIKISPYFSDVKDFIDADLVAVVASKHYLKFANHDAILFGADFSLMKKVLSNSSGDFSIKAIASYTRGHRKDGKADLYHLMPLNGKIYLMHEIGKWTTDLSAHFAANKKNVNEMRLEKTTPGYAYFDLGTSYLISKRFKIDFSITNILDHFYYLPLGGIDIVNSGIGARNSVAGIGRSYNTAFTFDF